MLKSNHYYNVNINTSDAHPTRCETRLEWAALGMNRYLCPVEVDNYVHFYSQVYGYPEDDIKRFKDRGRLGYWLRNGLYAVFKRGVISNNNFSLGCNVCGENKSYSRKCQICGKMTNFKSLACKAQREFISLYRSKEDVCGSPEKCSEIYIYAKDNVGECLKFGIKMDYLLNHKYVSDIQVVDGSAKLGYLNLGGQPIDLGTTK